MLNYTNSETRRILLLLVPAVALWLTAGPVAQGVQRYALETTAGLRASNVTVEAVLHQGRQAVRLTM